MFNLNILTFSVIYLLHYMALLVYHHNLLLLPYDLNIGDLCDKGGQLRPNVVWFGEDVPEIQTAIQEVRKCDILIIIGTSLNVYPAASLIDYAKQSKRIIIILRITFIAS